MMAEIAIPYIQPDGTHVIPVRRVHRPGQTPNESLSGEVCWSRRGGLTFRFHSVLKSPLDILHEPIKQAESRAGSVRALEMDPEWYAETADGSLVVLYATLPSINTSTANSWNIETGGKTESWGEVQGTACFAKVDFHRDCLLAYWHETKPGPRLYSPGWEIGNWGLEDRYEYVIGDMTCTSLRHSFPFDKSDGRVFVSAPNREGGLKGVWLTYQQGECSNPFWFPEPCHRIRGLMSILLGHRVDFVWRDTPATDKTLTRLYYGYHKGVDSAYIQSQLVPLVGIVEALSHGEAVADCLHKLDCQFAELRKLFDPEWVVSPLWTASDDYADNRLAHACVALERLSSAYHEHLRPAGIFLKRPDFIRAGQKKVLLARLRAAVLEVTKSENLTTDAVKILDSKINNLCQPTNADKLSMLFEELGITLSDTEKATMASRNLSMHGKKTLKNGSDTQQCDIELHRYDILRTLIGRTILHMLGYDGPYIDYAARPDTGNFPIRYATPSLKLPIV